MGSLVRLYGVCVCATNKGWVAQGRGERDGSGGAGIGAGNMFHGGVDR